MCTLTYVSKSSGCWAGFCCNVRCDGAVCCREVPLKMLADDRFCGRIIGKEGKIIKKLREDTDSKISVSK